MIGHNKGPSMEPGTSWRRHCWGAARKALLPHLPIEVLRGRLRRAEELGLNYRTYAGIRATTGRDIVAVLFSSNALELRRGQLLIDEDAAQKLERMQAVRRGLASAPLRPDEMLQAAPLHACHAAPPAFAPFGTQRHLLRAALANLTADQTILVGAYGAEAEWCASARLAGYLQSDAFFSG
jgi:hypothetical protein